MEHFDVIIVGAGPGGLTAATTLASSGRSVLLVEKNPVIGPKICAGGITLKDIERGISSELEGRAFSAMSVYGPRGNKTVIRMERPFLRTITRPTLGQWMARQLECTPVTVRTSTRVTEVRTKTVVLNGNNEVGFGHLIGADGSLSVVRRHLGIPVRNVVSAIQYNVPEPFEEIAFYLDGRLFGPGYAWVFPHLRFTSIGCGMLTTYETHFPLRTALRTWLKKVSIDVHDAPIEAWNINCDYRGHTFGNVHLVGDAAGFTSGLTGEGIYFAMVSGEEIAKKIVDPSYTQMELHRLLVIKRRHERLLGWLAKGGIRQRLLHEAAVLTTRNQWMAKKAVEMFG